MCSSSLAGKWKLKKHLLHIAADTTKVVTESSTYKEKSANCYKAINFFVVFSFNKNFKKQLAKVLKLINFFPCELSDFFFFSFFLGKPRN